METLKEAVFGILGLALVITIMGFLIYGMSQIDKACDSGDQESCATLDMMEMMAD